MSAGIDKRGRKSDHLVTSQDRLYFGAYWESVWTRGTNRNLRSVVKFSNGLLEPCLRAACAAILRCVLFGWSDTLAAFVRNSEGCENSLHTARAFAL